MVYIRIKRIKGQTYLYLVKTHWDKKLKCSKQKVIKYYGKINIGTINPQIVIDRDGSCQKCGSTENLTIDHIISLSAGGKNEYNNVWALCKTCNLKKQNKKIIENGLYINVSKKERLYNQLQLMIIAYSNKYKKNHPNWTEEYVHKSVLRRSKIVKLVNIVNELYGAKIYI